MHNRRSKSVEESSRRSRPSRHHHHAEPKVRRRSSESPSSGPNSWFGYKLVLVIAVAVVAYFGYKGFVATRVNTPFSADRLVDLSPLDQRAYYWGTYRSGLYFGTKTRAAHSLVTGLMWYAPEGLLQGRPLRLRHWCDQNDRLDRYGWTKHDGRDFGLQEILDSGVRIRTAFVKRARGEKGAGDWTVRISAEEVSPGRKPRQLSLLYYTAIENKTNGRVSPVPEPGRAGLAAVEGQTEELGYFRLGIRVTRSGGRLRRSYLATAAPSLGQLAETVYQSLKASDDEVVLPGERLLRPGGGPVPANFVVAQLTAELPLEIEVSFERSGRRDPQDARLVGESFDRVLSQHEQEFDERFERVFGLAAKGYNDSQLGFAKLALSNMIGSMGYFYGSALVQSEQSQRPVPYWRAPLFTAVPSRSFFPRGFLWDEGFHGLLLLHWDLDLELDILSHWFDLMNVEGWIPREVILGEEALARVPDEFVVQRNTNANPPTFLLTLSHILEHRRDEFLARHFDLLERLYPRLQAWYDWYNTTQRGELPGTYRWRGRDPTTNRELNPKTLTSGLDDYPRASHPSSIERHVDLRCWMALASRVMAGLAELLQRPSHRYHSSYEYLADNQLLNELHWSERTGSYADYGLHTDKVRLRKQRQIGRNGQAQQETVREVLETPVEQLVDSHFGYVSLFPFALRLVDADSPQLGKILDDLRNPDLLWTDMGLRSLGKSSPLHNKYNTEHDPPYWRAPIWINVNYLVVSALHHYANVDGPYKEQAGLLYKELRKNVIDNVYRQYVKTGYLWEHYGDKKGEGKGSHPFTGWTSLVVLMMAEIY